MIGFTASREELEKQTAAEPDPPEETQHRELSCVQASTQIHTSQPRYGWRNGQVDPLVGRSQR